MCGTFKRRYVYILFRKIESKRYSKITELDIRYVRIIIQCRNNYTLLVVLNSVYVSDLFFFFLLSKVVEFDLHWYNNQVIVACRIGIHI